MQYILKRNKGFTLIELAITFVVFAILVVIAVFSYSKFIKEAMISEGKALASSVAKVQIYHHSECGDYHELLNESYSMLPELDARQNKYFRNFSVYVPGNYTDAIFTVITTSEMNALAGIQVVLHVFKNKPSILTVIDIKKGGDTVDANPPGIDTGNENNNGNGSNNGNAYGNDKDNDNNKDKDKDKDTGKGKNK